MQKELWIQTNPLSDFSEAIRTLRESFFAHLKTDNAPSIVLSSPRRGDGCSTITANLAASIAHSGKKTLVIDADLLSDGLTEFFSSDRSTGFIDVINGSNTQPLKTAFDNLFFLPTGSAGNSMHPLDSPRVTDLLNQYQNSFDYILLDTAPILETSDPIVLGQKSSGIILVFRSGNFLRDDEIVSREILGRSGVKILGAVMNRIIAEDRDRYYTYQRMLERIEK